MLIPISVYLSTTISSKDHPKRIWFQLIKNRIFKILHNQKQLWPLAPVWLSFGTKGPTLGQKFVKIISAKLDFNSFSASWKMLKNTTLSEQFKNHIHRGIIDTPATNIQSAFLAWRLKHEMFTDGIPVNLWELLGGRSPPYQLF